MKAFFLILSWALSVQAQTWYQDHVLEYLIPDSSAPALLNHCDQLRQQKGLGNLRCSQAQRLTRIPEFAPYLNWLLLNLDPKAAAQDLRPRDSLGAQILANSGDDLLICNTKACLYVQNNAQSKAQVLDLSQVQSKSMVSWLKSQHKEVEIRPDSATLARLALEPDSSYLFFPSSRNWVSFTYGSSLGLGWSPQAGLQKDLVSNEGADSANLWNWAEPHSRPIELALGREHAGIFGYGFFGGWADLSARLRPETKSKIQNWTWTQWWLGVQLRLGLTLQLKSWEIYPHLVLAMSQHRFKEHFSASQQSFLNSKHLALPGLKSAELGLGLRLRSPLGLSTSYQLGLRHLSRSAEDNYQGPSATQIADNSSAFLQKLSLEWDF